MVQSQGSTGKRLIIVYSESVAVAGNFCWYLNPLRTQGDVQVFKACANDCSMMSISFLRVDIVLGMSIYANRMPRDGQREKRLDEGYLVVEHEHCNVWLRRGLYMKIVSVTTRMARCIAISANVAIGERD